METKTCSVCRNRKSVIEFYKNKSYADGYSKMCKSCNLEYDRQRIANHTGPATRGNKICTQCKQEKPVSEYNKRLRSKDGLRNNCKDCDHKSEHRYRKQNPSQAALAAIRQKYGLQEHAYKEMLEKHNYQCDICESKTRLCIDHCHKTGKIRGILCGKCNSGIGLLNDNIADLEKAIRYLKKYET